MIAESAVEAAARALAQPAPYDFDSYPQHWMQRARAALEAAAPHLMAQAWDEGYRECYERQMYEPVPVNPFRRPA